MCKIEAAVWGGGGCFLRPQRSINCTYSMGGTKRATIEARLCYVCALPIMSVVAYLTKVIDHTKSSFY